MANIYNVTVNNESPEPQDLFFFQKPAIYVGGQEIYSNSLGSKQIASKPVDGEAQVQFQMELQFYAGVQSQPTPITVGEANLSTIAEVPIDVNSKGTEADTTNMSVDAGLALSPPANSAGVEGGAFRIITPTFNPTTTPYNAGLAAKAEGKLVLSNFTIAEPNKDIDVQPIVIFYVATGSYQAGTVVNFDTTSVKAAVCDATTGKEDFFVTYNADGTWTVK